ncbi:uracil phosphoribosyltransferase [Thermovibrio sp.]
MRVKVLEGALKEELLTTLRKRETPDWLFRESMERLGSLLVSEALKELKEKEVEIETPVGKGKFREVGEEVVFIAVLRAGLSLVSPALRLFPKGRLGFIGVYRNEDSLEPVFYYKKYPLVKGRFVILDPMVATGNTAKFCVKELLEKGVPLRKITFVSVVCAPEGIENLSRFKELTLITASIDERLNSSGYIVPGLGDAGDRFCSTQGLEVVEGYGV